VTGVQTCALPIFKEQAGGSFSVCFRSKDSDSKYLAVDLGSCAAPFDWDGVKRSDLTSRMNSADYLVITPEKLVEGALALADYRKSRGYSVKTVLVEDIMNTFNDGTSHPEAIRDFIDYAYNNWRSRPRYVVLVGDGSYDYKNIQGYGDCLVPPLMTGTPDGLYPSDNQLVDVTGEDGKPDLAIGRLPAHTSEDVLLMLDKIKTYERSGGPWTDRIIFAVDDADDGGNFPEFNRKVETVVPSGIEKLRYTIGESRIETLKSKLIQGLNNGALIFNFIGHGGVDGLAEECLFETSDIAKLSNAERLPVAALMTCVTSLFAIPGFDSISESLVTRSGTGAVAAWSPAGLSSAPLATALDLEFLKAVYKNRKGTLGDAVKKACREYTSKTGDTDLTDVFILLGDPALELAE
jgi:hypothetical protein